MKRNRWIQTFMVVLFMAAAFSVGAAPKTITLMLGHSGSPTHHYHASSLKFAELVEQRTGGKVRINIFPADQLGVGYEELESVIVGTQDMVITPDAYLANHDPLFNTIGMPYQITSFDQVKKIPNSQMAKYLEKKLEAKGLVLLGWFANGFRLVTSNKVISTPADMKGLKLRIGSAKMINDVLAMLGASPTPIAMSETYTALQMGTVDGQENPTTNILSNKLYEVQKHLSLTRHQYVSQPLVMNKVKFDSLPAEYQKILRQAAAEVAAMDVLAVESDEQTQIEDLRKKGMTVTQPDVKAFKAALQPLYEKYAKTNGAEWAKVMKMFDEIQ